MTQGAVPHGIFVARMVAEQQSEAPLVPPMLPLRNWFRKKRWFLRMCSYSCCCGRCRLCCCWLWRGRKERQRDGHDGAQMIRDESRVERPNEGGANWSGWRKRRRSLILLVEHHRMYTPLVANTSLAHLKHVRRPPMSPHTPTPVRETLPSLVETPCPPPRGKQRLGSPTLRFFRFP